MNQAIEKSSCKDCSRLSDCFVQKNDFSKEFFDILKVKIKYKKGETIIKKGTYVSSIFYVLDGIVKVYLEGENKNIIVKLLAAKDFLGLTSLFGDQTYYFSASSLSNATICSIEQKSINKLLSESCSFTREIVKWYCLNYNLMFDKCINLSLRQLAGKVANSILYLNDDKFIEDDIYRYLSRKDIAELSGMAVESVVRILSDFSNEKIISLKGKRIEITNLEKLKNISKSG